MIFNRKIYDTKPKIYPIEVKSGKPRGKQKSAEICFLDTHV